MTADSFVWTRQSMALIATFAAAPNDSHHGWELMNLTGIKHRRVYELLYRFEQRGWLKSKRESKNESRPTRQPRRLYEITANGIEQYRRLCVALGVRQGKDRQALAPSRTGSRSRLSGLPAQTL